jgi:hypothetical protein
VSELVVGCLMGERHLSGYLVLYPALGICVQTAAIYEGVGDDVQGNWSLAMQ